MVSEQLCVDFCTFFDSPEDTFWQYVWRAFFAFLVFFFCFFVLLHQEPAYKFEPKRKRKKKCECLARWRLPRFAQHLNSDGGVHVAALSIYVVIECAVREINQKHSHSYAHTVDSLPVSVSDCNFAPIIFQLRPICSAKKQKVSPTKQKTKNMQEING